MAKKGPISKIEAFYIESKQRDLTLAEIAVDLDRSVSSIEKYLKKSVAEVPRQTGVKVGDQFARNDRGSVVMTENASQMSDEKRKSSVRKPQHCVTKIKKD
jgi:3-phosphoglycerate kinase